MFTQVTSCIAGKHEDENSGKSSKFHSNVQLHIQLEEANKWNILQWPSQQPDPNPIDAIHALHLLKTKRNTERQTNSE